jgi:hypothetical protein
MADSFPDINAGAWYLRGRCDLAWDVCEPVTGEVVAEVAVDSETHELASRGDAAASAAGCAAVRRFLLQLVAQPGQGLGQ